MIRRKLATAGVIAALGLSTSACASDPAFWEGVAIGLDTAALAMALSDPCYGAYSCAYRPDRDHRYDRYGHGRRDHGTGGHHRRGQPRPPHPAKP